jgi:hypothetical protein
MTRRLHGVNTAGHGVKPGKQQPIDHGMGHGMNTDLHGRTTNRPFCFQFNRKAFLI